MKKILVIGTSGSGKSTFANKLSKKLSIPHFQLDALQFKDNWEIKEDSEFFSAIENSLKNDSWIIDGNYGRTHHLTWPKADTVIWIDLPLWLTLYQNFSRSFKRALTKEIIWEGLNNRESFKMLFSKESVTLWALKTYKTNRERYTHRMSDPKLSHIKFHHLKSRRDIRNFLQKINREALCQQES
ncbi:AAA domain protein [Bacteriovorax sp. BSW11_IV]|uniref:ATPase AAA n=1 Tax=Bacteriovorax sp. BSW11_IV TaxID=1353529 RepID=UPI000389FF10|nr:ATPase AAA [Bacteriovorax sp. BSW11_IV]EQC48910.1 AAA domain protein [Bacteriovorax sp. BSW11_IV]